MRSSRWFVGAVVVGVLAMSGAARADGGRRTCAEDAQRLCSGVQPGGGRLVACLDQHASELSQPCQDQRAKWQARREAKLKELEAACGSEAQRYCSDVDPGPRALGACLVAHASKLSDQCKAEGKKLRTEARARFREGRRARRQAFRAAREACRGDVQRLCPNVTPGGGAIVQCLAAHRSDLSPQCAAAGEKLPARF